MLPILPALSTFLSLAAAVNLKVFNQPSSSHFEAAFLDSDVRSGAFCVVVCNSSSNILAATPSVKSNNAIRNPSIGKLIPSLFRVFLYDRTGLDRAGRCLHPSVLILRVSYIYHSFSRLIHIHFTDLQCPNA